MAYQHDYHRPGNPNLDYGDIESSRVSTRGILITLGILALLAVALMVFAGGDNAAVESQLENQPSLPLTGEGTTDPVQ